MVHDHGRAEDVTQEVFISALRRLRATDAPIIFKPWVYEIAKNACIDVFRRSRRAEEVSFDADEGALDRSRLVSRTPTPDAAVDQRMTLQNLQGAFGGLSEAHHQILVMRELEGLSYRQIGERLGMSRPSVESTLFRARRRLTEEYDELVSGERCRRVQEIIADGTAGRLGVRDARKLSRHVSHCHPCRRAACLAGVDLERLAPRTVRARIAAFLPLPAFLRRRWGADDHSAAAAGHGASVAQLSTAVASYADPSMSGWARAAAVAAGVAVAGVGAGVAGHDSHAGVRARHAGAPVVRSAPARAASAASAAPAPHAAAASRPAVRAPRHARAGATAKRSGRSTAPSSTSGAGATGPDRSASALAAPAPGSPVDPKGGTSAVPAGGGSAPTASVSAPKAALPSVQVSVPVAAAPVAAPTVTTVSVPAVTDATQAATDAANAAGGTVGGVTNSAGNLLGGG